RFVELTEPPSDVTDLRVRGRAVQHVAVRELFARARRFTLRLFQLAAPLEHDRAVYAAYAREDRERMLVGPAHRRLGPLRRAVVVADLFARTDEAAVHLAGRVRPEPALDREQHRVVEVAHPYRDVALVDQRPPLPLQRVVLPQPDRALARALAVALLVEQAVRQLAGGDALVEPAEPPRGVRERVGAVGLERGGVDGRGRGRVVRVLPLETREGVPSGGQRVDIHRRTLTPDTIRPDQRACASCVPMCSSTGRSSAAGLNSMNVTPSSVQPMWPPGQ